LVFLIINILGRTERLTRDIGVMESKMERERLSHQMEKKWKVFGY